MKKAKSTPTGRQHSRPKLLPAQKATRAAVDRPRGVVLARFFKTGKGEYGEGDRFLGITVPTLRGLAREFCDLSLRDCERLLRSPYNEERTLALMILMRHYARGDAKRKEAVFRLYWKNRRYVNNWNLVDLSAPHVVGAHLAEGERSLLFELARSPALWDRRIAVIATLAWIRQGDFADTFRLVEMLLADKHDLMHKACGWMLREIGKRDQGALEKFLARHAGVMPRTMLRYAIERFAPAKRRAYLEMKRGSVGLA